MSTYFEYDDEAIRHLKKQDKVLGKYIDERGKITRETTEDLFTALIESIISQQISSRAADTVCKRLWDISAKNAKALLSLSLEEIQKCGMTMKKAEYIRNICEEVQNKTLDVEGLHNKGDDEIIKELSSLKGVGVWTAEMLLIFSLGRPDVVSYGDLAIRRGMMKLYGLQELKKQDFLRYRERYSPYGSVASLYLWELSAKK